MGHRDGWQRTHVLREPPNQSDAVGTPHRPRSPPDAATDIQWWPARPRGSSCHACSSCACTRPPADCPPATTSTGHLPTSRHASACTGDRAQRPSEHQRTPGRPGRWQLGAGQVRRPYHDYPRPRSLLPHLLHSVRQSDGLYRERHQVRPDWCDGDWDVLKSRQTWGHQERRRAL